MENGLGFRVDIKINLRDIPYFLWNFRPENGKITIPQKTKTLLVKGFIGWH
jgi:hypothetical protein